MDALTCFVPSPTRFHRDIDQSKQFAIQSFAKQLLDVADNLSRALDSVPAEALEKKVCGWVDLCGSYPLVDSRTVPTLNNRGRTRCWRRWWRACG